MRSTVTLHVVSSLDGFIAKKDNSVSWMDSSDVYERGVTDDGAEVLQSIECFEARVSHPPISSGRLSRTPRSPLRTAVLYLSSRPSECHHKASRVAAGAHRCDNLAHSHQVNLPQNGIVFTSSWPTWRKVGFS